MKNNIFLLILLPILFLSCESEIPMGPQDFQSMTPYKFVSSAATIMQDTIYIPIYSDIYDKTVSSKSLLTATLSVRNTSMRDSIFIYGVDYYDTKGELVRNYLEQILLLEPLQTAEFIVEEADNSGGTGANFIVEWGANRSNLNPIFQGVMVLKSGQHALSFLTNGISISERPVESAK